MSLCSNKITSNCYIVFHWVDKFLQDFHFMLLLLTLRYTFTAQTFVYLLLHPYLKCLWVDFLVPSILALLTQFSLQALVAFWSSLCWYFPLNSPSTLSVLLCLRRRICMDFTNNLPGPLGFRHWCMKQETRGTERGEWCPWLLPHLEVWPWASSTTPLSIVAVARQPPPHSSSSFPSPGSSNGFFLSPPQF